MNPWFNQDRLRAGWRFLLGALVAFVANFLAIGIAVAVAHGKARPLDAVYRPLTMVLLLAGYALLLITAESTPSRAKPARDGDPGDQAHEGVMRALGLGRFPGWRRQALLGMAIGAAMIFVAVVWIAVSGGLREVKLSLNSHTLALAALQLFILATGAMAEELMFRSYPFQRLVEAVGPVLAIVAMSLLFGVAHASNPHASRLAMINTCAIGVLLCVAYLRTRALWLPWGIHFAWNTALGLLFGLPVSGLTDFAVIVRSRAVGPRWVTGGAYGIEASVVGTSVILLGFIPLILLTRKQSKLQAAPLAQPEFDATSASDQPSAGRIQL